MATHTLNIAEGQKKEDVAANATAGGTVTGGYGLTVIFDDTQFDGKTQLLLALDIIKQALVQNTWPPTP